MSFCGMIQAENSRKGSDCMTSLYLIRHGESLSNVEEAFTGQQDAPLSPTGVKQAESVCKFFDAISVDAIYASDLTRACQTVQGLSEKKGIRIQKTEKLREIFGGKWEGIRFSALETAFPQDYAKWKSDLANAVCTGGESIRALSARVYAFLSGVAAENPEKTIVIASHATPIRAFMTIVQHGDIAAIPSVPWVPNASITKVQYANGCFRIAEAGITSHLNTPITKLPDTV